MIRIGAEEAFDEILHSLMMKTFGKVGTERSFLKVINYTRLAI